MLKVLQEPAKEPMSVIHKPSGAASTSVKLHCYIVESITIYMASIARVFFSNIAHTFQNNILHLFYMRRSNNKRKTTDYPLTFCHTRSCVWFYLFITLNFNYSKSCNMPVSIFSRPKGTVAM